MSKSIDPNPPSRKDEDFPKTTTIPEGWMTEELTAAFSRSAAPSSNGSKPPAQSQERSNGADKAQPTSDENLFTRRLDPFPTGWDLSWM